MLKSLVNQNLKVNEPIILPPYPNLTPSEKKEFPSQNPDEEQKERKTEIENTAKIFGQSEEQICKEFKAFKALKIFKKFDVDLTGVSDAETLSLKLEETVKFGFGNIVINPKFIKFAKQKLKGKKIGVFAGVCYPFGEELYGVKKYASKLAFLNGADGIYLPVGTTDILRGKIDSIKREFAKIVKRHRKKKVFAVIEFGQCDKLSCEKILKALSKIKIAGIVGGTGANKNETDKEMSDLRSASGGKGLIVARFDGEKSREVMNLFTVADRVFIKNAEKVAQELKSNLEC